MESETLLLRTMAIAQEGSNGFVHVIPVQTELA